jgi:7-cyano-7-deazaguanine synthase
MTKGLVLLSGGMDSATCLFLAKKRFDEVYAISFDYGQRHKRELESAKKLCELARVREHRIQNIVMPPSKYNVLTGNVSVPKQSENKQRTTVVGYRNSIHLTYAAAFAGTLGIETLVHGANAEDNQNYPDCRPEFFNAMEASLSFGGTEDNSKIEIWTPLITLWKSDIAKVGLEINTPYEFSHTCYNGWEPPCFYNTVKEDNGPIGDLRAMQQFGVERRGSCDACLERVRGFEKVGVIDPLFGRLRNEGKI